MICNKWQAQDQVFSYAYHTIFRLRYFKTEEVRNLSAEFWIDNVGTNIVLELIYENGEYREEISSSMIL